jgi:hypothetical protein
MLPLFILRKGAWGSKRKNVGRGHNPEQQTLRAAVAGFCYIDSAV